MTSPSVAYMTLSWNPFNMHTAVRNACEQSYKSGSDRLYLIHQDKKQGITYMDCGGRDKGLQIVNLYHHGAWGALFICKVQTFLKHCTEPITIVFDEDDGFEYFYAEQCVKAIDGYDAVCNWHNVNEEKHSFKYCRFTESWGTMAIKTDVLRKAVDIVVQMYPALQVNGGPLDGQLRHVLEDNFKVGNHNGIRYFRQWSGASTAGKRSRRGMEIIDG